MASKAPSPQSDPNYWSPEKCQEVFRDFTTSPWEIDVPDYEKRILEERIADYCENGVHMIPFEEVEKELVEELKKHYREHGLDGIELDELDEFEKELMEEITKG